MVRLVVPPTAQDTRRLLSTTSSRKSASVDIVAGELGGSGTAANVVRAINPMIAQYSALPGTAYCTGHYIL